MAESSPSSSADDIPSRADVKQKGVEPESDEEGEEGEEEYVVEKILGHEFDIDDGTFKYEVKWDGWTETTWEPLENLEETEELRRYHKSLGGSPSIPKVLKVSKSSTKQKSSKKRKLDQDAAPMASTTVNLKSNKQGEIAGRHAPTILSDNWEEDIVQVETLEQDFRAGVIIGYVRWTNGKKTRHTLATLNKKCPQQMLRFYEAHLQFSQSTSSETRSDNTKEDGPVSKESVVVAKDEAVSPRQLETVST